MKNAVNEILKVAMSKEIKAITTYSNIKKITNNQNLQDLLDELIGFEKEHKRLIENIMLKGDFTKIGNEATEDIEHFTSIVDEDQPGTHLNDKQLIEYAIREEDRACILYERMYNIFKSSTELADLTSRLANEEKKHIAQLREILKQM